MEFVFRDIENLTTIKNKIDLVSALTSATIFERLLYIRVQPKKVTCMTS